MRATVAIVFCSLVLVACGSTKKTVIVAPPDSTTVVDQHGHTQVIVPPEDGRTQVVAPPADDRD